MVASTPVGASALSDLPMHLLTDCDVKSRRWNLVAAESAKHKDRGLLHSDLLHSDVDLLLLLAADMSHQLSAPGRAGSTTDQTGLPIIRSHTNSLLYVSVTVFGATSEARIASQCFSSLLIDGRIVVSHVLTRLRNRFSQLGCQELTSAFQAFLLEL